MVIKSTSWDTYWRRYEKRVNCGWMNWQSQITKYCGSHIISESGVSRAAGTSPAICRTKYLVPRFRSETPVSTIRKRAWEACQIKLLILIPDSCRQLPNTFTLVFEACILSSEIFTRGLTDGRYLFPMWSMLFLLLCDICHPCQPQNVWTGLELSIMKFLFF